MDLDEMEARIHELEAELASMRSNMSALVEFSATLLGRYAHEKGLAPDLGLPTSPGFTNEYDAQMEMLRRYNIAAGHL